jgi:ABC-2 type transporter.
MNTFFTILANDYRRTVPRLAGTLIMTFVMFVMILLAVYVTHLQQIKGHIAYIPSGTDVSVPGHPSYLDVTVLLTEPPRSSLYKQTYDAVVRAGADGTITVDTLRNDAFRAMVVRAFSTRPGADAAVPQPAGTAARNTGVNIVGFLLMFLLMQSFSNMFVFADDKEQGQLVRISSTPAPFASYLAAHCVYSVSLIAPSWIILAVLDACGVNVGFTLAEYALLILVISFSGVCFALLLNTFIRKPDNANMFGNAAIMLATLVSGSFYAAPPEHSAFNIFVRTLPQKGIMDFARALASGSACSHAGTLLYVLCIGLAMLAVSCAVLRKRR